MAGLADWPVPKLVASHDGEHVGGAWRQAGDLGGPLQARGHAVREPTRQAGVHGLAGVARWRSVCGVCAVQHHILGDGRYTWAGFAGMERNVHRVDGRTHQLGRRQRLRRLALRPVWLGRLRWPTYTHMVGTAHHGLVLRVGRQPVDRRLRRALHTHRNPCSSVASGTGGTRRREHADLVRHNLSLVLATRRCVPLDAERRQGGVLAVHARGDGSRGAERVHQAVVAESRCAGTDRVHGGDGEDEGRRVGQPSRCSGAQFAARAVHIVGPRVGTVGGGCIDRVGVHLILARSAPRQAVQGDGRITRCCLGSHPRHFHVRVSAPYLVHTRWRVRRRPQSAERSTRITQRALANHVVRPEGKLVRGAW